jgi:hypothetical protein
MHHINGVFAADIRPVPAPLAILRKKRADPLFDGYFCLDAMSIALT